MLQRISPQDAQRLILTQGYTYVDVRSIPEYEAGHPCGAVNVPLLHRGPAGMTPNPDFLGVVEGAFAKDAKLVVGCQGGGRSQRAADALIRAGYTQVVEQRAGFGGSRDPVEAGWQSAGLPVEAGAGGDHGYEALRAKK